MLAEPPSLPVCEWDGASDVGGSVWLSCSVEEGVPTPEIRWEKVNPEEISLPINMEGQYLTLVVRKKKSGKKKSTPHKINLGLSICLFENDEIILIKLFV